MSLFQRIFVAILLFLLPLMLFALPPENETGLSAGSRSIDNTTFIDANNILMFMTNHGNFGRDLGDYFGYDYGTFFPYFTQQDIADGTFKEGVLYAAGLWLGGRTRHDGQLRIAIAEYSDEYVPGPMKNGTFQPDDPSFKVYKLYQDSIYDNPNNDYVNWPVEQGAPVGPGGLPLVLGDQTLWTVYNDADPGQHTNNSGETDPLGIEVQQLMWAQAGEGYTDTIFVSHDAEITHIGEADIEVEVLVVDYAQVMPDHNYRIEFSETISGDMEWSLIDASNETILIANRPLPDNSTDEVEVHGLKFILKNAPFAIDQIIETANGDGPLDPPEDVMYSINSTGEWYIRSDQGNDFSRMNWRGNLGQYDWEIRFTSEGSQHYDWSTDMLFQERAPFEVWNIGIGTPDDPSDDVRVNFSIIDDDASGGWSWQDRLYPWEVEYVEPAPEYPNYVWPDDFRIGRIVFHDYSTANAHPAEGTVVRFVSKKLSSATENDTFYIEPPEIESVTTGSEGNTIYIAYFLKNKGGHYIDSLYISFWADPDIGLAGDDLVGCDTLENIFFAYNGDEYDEGHYNWRVPAMGFEFLRGPLVPSTGDTADYFGTDVPGYKNLGMSSFNKYIIGTDPNDREQTYNYMRGLNAFGDPYIYMGNVTSYVHSGDPVAGTGDLDAIPSDRRMMASTGPITMNPGDSQFVLLRMGVGQGYNYLESITKLKNVLDFPFSYPDQLDPSEIVHPSNEWINVYCGEPTLNGNPLVPDDSVKIYDSEAHLCGLGVVSDAGSLLFTPVYRDYAGSMLDEGAEPGEELLFKINEEWVEPIAPVYWTEFGDRVEVCEFVGKKRVDIALNQGWNLISWNCVNDETDLENLVGDVMDNVELIMGYDAGGLTYDPLLPDFSTLNTLDHYNGYWFKMYAPDTLYVSGSFIPEEDYISLINDWNIAPYWPDAPLPVPTALGEIYDDLLLVNGWMNGNPATFDPALPEYATLDNMMPGYGYWLRMGQPGVLSYSNVVPPAPARFAVKDIPDYLSRVWINLYSSELTINGKLLDPGTKVEAIDLNGRLIGEGIVGEKGKFGFMPVYGDDPVTEKIEGPAEGERFHLRIGGVKTENEFTWSRNTLKMEIGELRADENLPAQFTLHQNYPNPFNPSTGIKFSLPEAVHVTITVYDILGRRIATVIDDYYEAGNHSIRWDGHEAGASSGVYFYRMKAGSFEDTRKMLLLK